MPASVTFAHEFNHLLQQNYDSFQDLWMFESTAVWAEQKVFPQIDDYVNYVRAFAQLPRRAPHVDLSARPAQVAEDLRIGRLEPLARQRRGRLRGRRDPRRLGALRRQTKPPDYSLAAYDRAIEAAGGRSFSREFASFAAATAEWRTGLGNFPDHAEYPDVKRNRVAAPGQRRAFALQHTAYRLFQVEPGRSDDEISLRLTAESESCDPHTRYAFH